MSAFSKAPFNTSLSEHQLDKEWQRQPPYKTRESGDGFDVKWRGRCHCGKVQYQVSRENPLSSKYCHCRTCQRLHGAPFQWAAIFHKTDINFVDGHRGLGWYDPSSCSMIHHLPCKVHCESCWTPILDEGRNMIMLFPSLIEGVESDAGRHAFKPSCHLFYPQRVVDFTGDGLEKWSGLDGKSDLLRDDGERVKGW